MPKKTLDASLLAKMELRTKKPRQYIREQISRRSGRSGVSSLAAQLIWAHELGLATARALNKALPDVRGEVRAAQQAAPRVPRAMKAQPGAARRRRPATLGAAEINLLLNDAQLRDRCRDLLLAKKHYDRVLREATTVLDDRLKQVSGIQSLNPSALVARALNPDPNKAVIVVSDSADEQQGFFLICKGIILTFRNHTHHNLSGAFTMADALKFCGFIDTLLGVISKGVVHSERA